ncbi:hypothetical protein HA402_004534 [Bradysia odoriphaga]|nr:hypothetical protein HA402_004534 [Bradysia odoriphaga]
MTVLTLEDVLVTTNWSSEEVGEEPLDSSSTRGLVGDIATIKKVVEVIQTVGGKVIPAIIDSQKSTIDAPNKPPRFKLLKALKSENKEESVAQQD